ncbi:hypothetical protein [Glaciimonas sp. PCH181]|uniref:hypothetical protein n=1 Tax=Glaciimonas sp. PCH181 TaxID=2133943 RepID=UPI000D3A2B53|nr:hypothetical protein [Glaciimonas sp. PCH181]PUA20188.1 hypothetical protein C7W93_10545 [Glaciimonas sp. PCH181]
MRNKTISVCLAAVMLSLGCTQAIAQHGGGFGGGFHGGGGGFRGNNAAQTSGGQFHGHRDFVGRRGAHFRDFHGRGIFIAGGPFFFDPFFYDGYGYYGNQLIYAQPGINYSFYCRNPAGYYPDVDACPTGWLQVVPDGP